MSGRFFLIKKKRVFFSTMDTGKRYYVLEAFFLFFFFFHRVLRFCSSVTPLHAPRFLSDVIKCRKCERVRVVERRAVFFGPESVTSRYARLRVIYCLETFWFLHTQNLRKLCANFFFTFTKPFRSKAYYKTRAWPYRIHVRRARRTLYAYTRS